MAEFLVIALYQVLSMLDHLTQYAVDLYLYVFQYKPMLNESAC